MNYVCAMVTEVGVVIEDKERFEREVAELDAVTGGEFKDAYEIFELENMDGEWVLDIRGHDTSLELYCELLPPIEKNRPPEDWTDMQKEAHARTFGYPIWLNTVTSDEMIDVVAFLQRHIKQGTHAIIKSAGFEGLRSVDGWVCVFTKDDSMWDSLMETTNRLIEEMKIPL